jgi:hypothetical protein
MSDKLRCPSCGSEDLGTAEQIKGLADATFRVAADGSLAIQHQGGTEVFWDTSTTVGYGCGSCGDAYEEEDWREHLVANQPPPTCTECDLDAEPGETRCGGCLAEAQDYAEEALVAAARAPQHVDV